MRDKIEQELRHNLSETDAKERTNNILQAHGLGEKLSVDDLYDALTYNGAHAGITDQMARQQSAYIIHGILNAN